MSEKSKSSVTSDRRWLAAEPLLRHGQRVVTSF
jgi:hypothetical protein